MQDPITFFNFEYIYQLIYYLLTGDKNFAFLDPLWRWIMIIGYLLSTLFIIGIAYSLTRLSKIRKEESEILRLLTDQALDKNADQTNKRWLKVVEHIESENENDWRLAIIEADLMLDEMMSGMGYAGDSIGEKLKSVEKSDFTTIGFAWDAHKVRNRIAHEGSNFVLSKHEARRVVDLYKTVFNEFEYI